MSHNPTSQIQRSSIQRKTPYRVLQRNLLVLERATPQLLVTFAEKLAAVNEKDGGLDLDAVWDEDYEELVGYTPTLIPLDPASFARMAEDGRVTSIQKRARSGEHDEPEDSSTACKKLRVEKSSGRIKKDTNEISVGYGAKIQVFDRKIAAKEEHMLVLERELMVLKRRKREFTIARDVTSHKAPPKYYRPLLL